MYEWPNWVFACHRCNRSKSYRWPPGGYVGSCTEHTKERLEGYFNFDVGTGVLTRKAGSSASRHRRVSRVNYFCRLLLPRSERLPKTRR